MNIAITGGIGAGKSTMMEHLKVAYPNANFYSMDKFVDALYQEKSWLDWLKERFGTVDRKELSNRAFACDSVRAALNTQSSMKIGVVLGKVLATGDSDLVNFIEFPLLFETQMQDQFDTTILVTADTPTRIQRVVARGKKTAEQAEAVVKAQMPEDKKRMLATITVDTSTTSAEVCAKELIYILREIGV